MTQPSIRSWVRSVLIALIVFAQPAFLLAATPSATPATAGQPVLDGTFPVEGEPWLVAANGDAVWVATLAGDMVRLDPLSGEVIATTDPPGTIADLALDGDILWILTTNGGGTRRVEMPAPPGSTAGSTQSMPVAGLHRADVASGEVIETIRLERYGGGLAVTDGAVWTGAAAWTEDEPGMLLRVDKGSNVVVSLPIADAFVWVSAVTASADGVWAIAQSNSAPAPAVLVLVDPETSDVVQTVRLEPRMWNGSTLTAVPGGVWLTAIDLIGSEPVATLVRVDAGTGVITSREIDGFTHSLALGHDRLWMSDCVAATVASLDPVTGDSIGDPVLVGHPAPEGFDPWTQPVEGLSCPQVPAMGEDVVWVPVPGSGVVVRLRP